MIILFPNLFGRHFRTTIRVPPVDPVRRCMLEGSRDPTQTTIGPIRALGYIIPSNTERPCTTHPDAVPNITENLKPHPTNPYEAINQSNTRQTPLLLRELQK